MMSEAQSGYEHLVENIDHLIEMVNERLPARLKNLLRPGDGLPDAELAEPEQSDFRVQAGRVEYVNRRLRELMDRVDL
jgi:hypothetical protein